MSSCLVDFVRQWLKLYMSRSNIVGVIYGELKPSHSPWKSSILFLGIFEKLSVMCLMITFSIHSAFSKTFQKPLKTNQMFRPVLCNGHTLRPFGDHQFLKKLRIKFSERNLVSKFSIRPIANSVTVESQNTTEVCSTRITQFFISDIHTKVVPVK